MGRTRSQRQPKEVPFTNVGKIFFPQAGFTKGDLILYYLEVAPALLPHLRDRPVTVIRMPDGVSGEAFYEKNVPRHAPAWVPRTAVPRSAGGVIQYPMINDARTLAWYANHAAIELHPFLHRAADLNRPTHVAFDLDPGEGADLATCLEVGFHLREVLAQLGLDSYPKVSGSKGLQVYVPLNTPVTYEAVTPFAHSIADLLQAAHPDLIVANMAKVVRRKKVLIDWSQNHPKKTTVSAYSVRGKHDAPWVSTPVTWEELRRVAKSGRLERLRFSPADVLRRVKKSGDLFAPVLKQKQKLPREFIAAVAGPKTRPAALRRYDDKRDFARTAEPGPAASPPRAAGSPPRFVIQKHAASHLHYDFRLEMDGVLKSWAIPKGLATEPGIKRAAFQTEDHPLAYLTFEGTIPKGQYGGGTVMVWDLGTYDLIGGDYGKGDLKLRLKGKKLQGEWHLFRIKSADDKPLWLIQRFGPAAKPISPRQEDKSALSGRTLKAITTSPETVSPGPSTAAPKVPSPPPKRRARPVPGPAFVSPMLAKDVPILPEGPGWVYEIKLDGFRGLALKHGDRAQLLSRQNKDLAADFPALIPVLQSVPAGSFLLDGEIVALDAEGKPSFQLLQRRKEAAGTIVYYAFDLLHLDGEDWRERPLHKRKAALARLVAGTGIRYSVSFDGPVDRVRAGVEEMGLEGIIAKRRDSTYTAGERSGAWVKFKLSPRQEFVIGGYKRGQPLESLVVGYYEAGKLLSAGHVRQGLNPKSRRELHRALQLLAADVCPFANLPSAGKGRWGEGFTSEKMKEIQWVMPKLVAQVSFAEWTRDGNLRHGTFLGLRTDKNATQVGREP